MYDKKKFSSLGILMEFAMGLIIGLSVEHIATWIGLSLNLSMTATVFLQLILISSVLHIIFHYRNNVTKLWSSKDTYGVIFISVFFASQKNIEIMINNIHSNFLSLI